ncbi:MAG TPA: hydantoinase/oxoprolinase family protein [Candidatus Binatia bacterium]|nr:hydantoinase/oxoprolinase family protein [Candidatus Binatia bacterium]
MNPAPRLRVGIDVGGTFTDVVAIDAATRELVAAVKVPTSHGAGEGVAAGIVSGIEQLLTESGVDSGSVGFIAHSTTQATNALLEGDLAPVGVLGLVDGLAWLSRRQMRFGALALGSGASFAPAFTFASAGDERAMREGVERLISGGAQAIAASESFGVDRPGGENRAVAYARERGVDATSGHDVSAAYGLRARTRTAALNAAILPKMLRTARMTADAVERAAIPAPLMVMRSDGGVMDVGEIERRPILTLLSGPAAGIAGALLYERLSEGVFVEVGGTSSDCSAIRAGRPQMRPARIGGHRTMLRTLDVRTLGIGGGSMLRIHEGGVRDIGPRSAHIAGCAYATFVAPQTLEGARIECIAPTPQDQADYAVLVTRDGARVAITATCAANLLGSVPEGAFARGNAESARLAFDLLARHVGGDGAELARSALAIAVEKLRRTIDPLIADYAFEPQRITIVGGGGAAGALVPALAAAMRLPHRIARDAEVIAPVGVALALVRDVVERTIFAPTPHEIAAIRREAADRVIAAGASPDSVEVEVEIDTQRSRVTAAASGATALLESAAGGTASEDERRLAAAQSLDCDPAQLEPLELTDSLSGYARSTMQRGRFGRVRTARDVRVLDERGVVRLALRDPVLVRTTAGEIEARVRAAIESATEFGDVGRALPALYVLRGGRIAAFEGLTSAEQAAALAAEETEGCRPDEGVTLLLVARSA